MVPASVLVLVLVPVPVPVPLLLLLLAPVLLQSIRHQPQPPLLVTTHQQAQQPLKLLLSTTSPVAQRLRRPSKPQTHFRLLPVEHRTMATRLTRRPHQ